MSTVMGNHAGTKEYDDLVCQEMVRMADRSIRRKNRLWAVCIDCSQASRIADSMESWTEGGSDIKARFHARHENCPSSNGRMENVIFFYESHDPRTALFPSSYEKEPRLFPKGGKLPAWIEGKVSDNVKKEWTS